MARSSRKANCGGLLALVFILAASCANAGPWSTSLSFELQANAAGGLIATPSFTTLNGPTRDDLETIGFNPNAFGSGYADLGTLGALAGAQILAANDSDPRFPRSIGGNALASVTASWTDFLSASSSVLPAGSHGHALISIGFDGLTSIEGSAIDANGNVPTTASFDNSWSIGASLTDLSTGSFLGGLCAEGGVVVTGACPFLPPNVPFASEVSLILDFVIGQETAFMGALTVNALSDALTNSPGQVASASTLIDGFHTAHFYFQPLDDFVLVAASGHDYSRQIAPPSGVPEPGTLALLLAGFAGFGFPRVYRRRSG